MTPDLIDSVVGNEAGGAVVWAVIRMEIRFLWRDLSELKQSHKDHVKEVSLELGKCLKQT